MQCHTKTRDGINANRPVNQAFLSEQSRLNYQTFENNPELHHRKKKKKFKAVEIRHLRYQPEGSPSLSVLWQFTDNLPRPRLQRIDWFHLTDNLAGTVKKHN